MTPFRLTPQVLAQAVTLDRRTQEACLLPDGATVHAPDDDLGFTVTLEAWRQAGGRELADPLCSPRDGEHHRSADAPNCKDS